MLQDMAYGGSQGTALFVNVRARRNLSRLVDDKTDHCRFSLPANAVWLPGLGSIAIILCICHGSRLPSEPALRCPSSDDL